MEILHELNQLDLGGVERIVGNIAKFDQANKHKVLAYQDGPIRSFLEDCGVEIHVVDEKTGGEADVDADLVHIHCGGGISRLASQLGHAFPIVETIHSPVKSRS